MSFLGPATMKPKPSDVARYVGLLRETVKKKPADQTLAIVASFMHAVAHFALHTFGHRETLAMIAEVKTSVEETDTTSRINPWH